MNNIIISNKKPIVIGRLGENQVTTIRFAVNALFPHIQNATYGLIHQRHGDVAPYPCVTKAPGVIYDTPDESNSSVPSFGGYIDWVINSADLGKAGSGTAQLTAYKDGAVAKSIIFTTITLTSMGTTDAPDPVQLYIDRIVRAGQEAVNAAADAEESAEEAAGSAEAAAGSAEAAAQSASDAQQILDDISSTVETELTEAKESGDFDGPRGYSVYGGSNIIIANWTDGTHTENYCVDKVDAPDAGIGDFILGKRVGEISLMKVAREDANHLFGDGVMSLIGQMGQDGEDGYSPTVTVTTITGGHRVTITDKNGAHNFDVMDGEDGEGGSSITVDSALSDSSTNPVQNKVVKAALDTIDGSFLKNSLAIVQAPPAIGSMLKVAESYFDQAYGSNTHLVYDSGHGLFAPSTTSSVEGEEGYPAIVCSQFAQALMKGIRYAQSRYVLANNHIAGWGWTTDGSGTYADFGTPVNDDASKDYMDARHQLKYALDHGWAYTISDVRKQIRPGDFIFYGLANVSTWEDVTHVALVLHVGLDDDYMITIESDDQTVSGKRVGVVTKRFAIEKKGGHYLFGARFPVFDGASPDMVGSKILEDSALTGTNTAYMIKQYDTPSIMPAGFYTAIIDGDFAASRVEIGVRYADAAANTFDYSNGRMVKNAGRYAVTFYAAKPFVQVRVGATANNAYIINRWALFKGYFGQDWNLDPDVPTAADVGAIPVPTSATAGQFLVYNGTAWVAQTLATWQGGNY